MKGAALQNQRATSAEVDRVTDGPLPGKSRKLVKGNEALASGALVGGLQCFFGYPITPQNEVPEKLAELMPPLGRVFLQAESELASINMVYGAAAAGHRAMTSSSGPGISLMMEGLSYIAGARLPCLIVNVMRGGPGLGNIAPSQSDYFQACKGGGHGDYHSIVLAPWSVQEMFDFPKMAFELAERYRCPAIILADAVLGSMLEPAWVDDSIPPLVPSFPSWTASGRAGRNHKNVVHSLYLKPEDLAAQNELLQKAYREMRREIRFDARLTEDADYLFVGFGISARLAWSAATQLRRDGLRVGFFRPITLFPFPEEQLRNLAENLKGILVCELNSGQMVQDVRLAVEGRCPVEFFGKMGGVLPPPEELVEAMRAMASRHRVSMPAGRQAGSLLECGAGI
jgi:2-oxoglutarate ferredoxin oxidoreductase subunit alpha